MVTDEQLISRNDESDNEANDSESGALDSDIEDDEDGEDEGSSLREEIQKSKNGLSPESTGDIRKDRMVALRVQKEKELELKKKIISKPLNPAKLGLAKLLQAAWENLLDSFGLTLIWIDLHYILSYVFGKNLFCDLGEEWVINKVPSSGSGQSADKLVEEAGKSIGTVEKMGCACLNGGCLLLVLLNLTIIALIVGAISNPLQVGVEALGDLLCAAVGGCSK